MEEWKDIKGYEGIYQVSNLGNVRSLARGTKHTRLIKPRLNSHRYIVKLNRGEKSEYKLVSYLVASAFLPDEGKDYVENIDNDLTNNRVENLRWSDMTYKESKTLVMSKSLSKGKNKYNVKDGIAYVEMSNTHNIMMCDADVWEKHKNQTWFEHDGYASARVNTKIRKMHRLIKECPKGYVIDHINRNKLDNRRDNIRVTTQCVNCINKGASRKSKTGYKGIYEYGNRYIVSIRVKGKRKHLGIYNTLSDAICVRKQAEKEYHERIIDKETLR